MKRVNCVDCGHPRGHINHWGKSAHPFITKPPKCKGCKRRTKQPSGYCSFQCEDKHKRKPSNVISFQGTLNIPLNDKKEVLTGGREYLYP